MSRWARTAIPLCLLLVPWAPVRSDEAAPPRHLVIDTDLGLDDAVAVAAALQAPNTELLALVAAEGVLDGPAAADALCRMAGLFNRGDVAIYQAARREPAGPVPPFRKLAGEAIEDALAEVRDPPQARPFTPDAYRRPDRRTTVLVLGPLTNLAAALRQDATLREAVAEVIVAAPPNDEAAWNLRYDADAAAAVRRAGLTLRFVNPGRETRKPAAWAADPPKIGRGTSIAESFLRRLLANDAVRTHYTEQRPAFHDEAALIYALHPDDFTESPDAGCTPRDPAAVVAELVSLLTEGRQQRETVLLADPALPDDAFRREIRERKARIIAAHGTNEWLAQVLLNEMHQHLGAYSIIGVKMGLRAAELLNAPHHAMRVTSEVTDRQPISCLNDGLILAVCSTPGRGLFRHVPGPPERIQATFEYNGRRLTLTLKKEYQERIQRRIAELLKKHTLEDEAYWAGVAELGLEIWETWSRRDLFDVTGGGAPSPAGPTSGPAPGPPPKEAEKAKP